MSSHITRVRIAPRFADLKVEPVEKGARLSIGNVHVHLSPRDARRLADALVDATEKGTA